MVTAEIDVQEPRHGTVHSLCMDMTEIFEIAVVWSVKQTHERVGPRFRRPYRLLHVSVQLQDPEQGCPNVQ